MAAIVVGGEPCLGSLLEVGLVLFVVLLLAQREHAVALPLLARAILGALAQPLALRLHPALVVRR